MRPLVFIVLFLFGASLALGLDMPPPSDAHVNDFAHFFSAEETAALRAILDSVERSTAEIVVVTVNSTYPQTPAAFRTELFRQWEVGEKESDNGLLIVYAVQEHRIEVETGYGLEGVLPDAKIGRLLDEYYVPLRDQQNISAGIIAFTQHIVSILESSETNGDGYLSQNQRFALSPSLINAIIILALVAWFVFSHFHNRKHAKRCPKDGLKMKYFGLVGGYALYRCMKGHEEKISERIARGTVFGGFGGGGLSGGGGFGGFGGGSSGGGG